MEIEIIHSFPKHKFFLILQPKREYAEQRLSLDNNIKPLITLTDSEKVKLGTAELYAILTVHDDNDFKHLSLLSFLAYGWDPASLKKELLIKYPQLNQKFEVEYWLLKRKS